MKIHNISLVGFGPFRDNEEVDFTAFDDDGIFLIAGKTGAGKTSILDAVTFALYGRIPRYDNAPGEAVRSDFLSRTELCRVTLVFSTSDGHYRVTRSPAYERAKKSGEGMTPVAATFELAELVQGTWQVIETKLGNAEKSVFEIVKLNAKQFQQVILLAQGQFQEFLVADSEKRRDLLRQLFGSERFSDYSRTLEERSRALRNALTHSSTAIDTNVRTLAVQSGHDLPEDLDSSSGNGVSEFTTLVAAAVTERYDKAQAEQKAAEGAHAHAKDAHDAAKSVLDRQGRLATALARQAELELQTASVAADRSALAAARRADVVSHAVAGYTTASTTQATTEATHAAAVVALQSLVPDAAFDLDSLNSASVTLTELGGNLRQAEAREATLDRLTAAHDAAAKDLKQFDESLEADRLTLGNTQSDLESTSKQIAVVEPEATTLAAAQTHLTDLSSQRDAARKAENTSALLKDAMATRLKAGTEVTAVSRRRDQLHARQLSEFAGVLASDLTEGQACQVCGSTSHPLKASLAVDHVDDDQLASIGSELEAAEERAQTASTDVTRLETLLATQLKAAGDREVAALEAEVEVAAATAEKAETAKKSLDDLMKKRDELIESISALQARINSAHAGRTTLAQTEVLAGQAVLSMNEELAHARDAFATVNARRESVENQLRATIELKEAKETLHRATEALDEATLTLNVALAKHGFADADAVTSATLTTEAQNQLDERIHTHEAASTAVTTLLTSDELRDVPAEPVDIEPVTTTLNETATSQREAIAACGAAKTTHEAVDELVTAITNDVQAAAELRRESDVVHRLSNTVRGQNPNTMKMALEAFALAAELEEIIKAANVRLRTMTGGRYEFEHSDALAGHGAQSGLALNILDAHTGDTRSPQSLSGGEKFQASLALALGLAEVVTSRAGGLRLDTLFIDEGFGSLDPDTLETTMATLDNLKEGGRTIGLISHVEAMKESIPAQLFVDVTPGGWSTIRQE
ncbi:MAG: SMC family ATPase [Actinobacteria bacterium]|nr:SMC family ATPase [Actinomycetota bacterium]